MLRTFSIARPRQLSEVLKWEAHHDYSREQGTALAGQAFDLGQVLGRVAVSGKLVVLDPTKADGSEKAAGVALAEVEAGAADVDGVPYSRRQSLFSASGLRWPDGITADQQAAALGQLAERGLVVRDY